MAEFDEANLRTGEAGKRAGLATSSLPHITYVSWRSVLAGFFISVLCFTILLALGMGIGGVTYEIGESGSAWTWSSALWVIAAATIALFVGSYIAGRISNYITVRIGAVQGLITASIFFALILYQMGMTIGWAGTRISSALGGLGSAMASVIDNPEIMQAGQNLIRDLNLQSPPEQVAQGVIRRLIQGNTQGARDYLASQANIPPQQADQRINQAMTTVQNQMSRMAEATSSAIGGMGWVLFALLFLGSAAATVGGGLGSMENFRHPLGKEEGDLYDLSSHRAANM